jgi:putative SOS response-associated peptidase YedK
VAITVPSNELVAQIHDRMPLILPRAACERWLSGEPDPHDLLVPFPAELMAMWPVSTRVNKPENDDASRSTQRLDSRTQRRAGRGTAGCMALRRA